MHDIHDNGSMYTIGHLVQCTGLTDRTIRNYMSSGILTGEKINGVWHFTAEQLDTFLSHPAVYPSIRAKNNAHVFDFLRDSKKDRPQVCIVLDLPGADRKAVSEFFCYSISNGAFCDIHFSLDAIKNDPRVILTGNAEEVLALVNQFYLKYQV